MIYSADASFFICTQQSWKDKKLKTSPAAPSTLPFVLPWSEPSSDYFNPITSPPLRRWPPSSSPDQLCLCLCASSTAERERERGRERGKERNMEGNRTHCPLPLHWLPSLPLPILHFPFSRHHHPCSSRYEFREIISDTSERAPFNAFCSAFSCLFLQNTVFPPPPPPPPPPGERRESGRGCEAPRRMQGEHLPPQQLVCVER